MNNVFDKAKLDLDFAEKLKKESPTQFLTLIKMHLSFMLENLNENEPDHSEKSKTKKNWLFPKKKPSSICSSSNVKSPDSPLLTEAAVSQLKVLMRFLEKDEHLCQEGIFRKTGSVSRQQELKFLVNHLKPLNLEEFTSHDVASVLKSILADLPEPLLTETYFPAYAQIADICNSKENDEQARIKNALQLLCLLLPDENRIVLENLINLLHKASEKESYNKMTADTLATLFTPHLICPRKLQPEALHATAANMTRMISFMITSGSSIFLVPEKLSIDIRAYFVEQKRRRETPEKILDDSISDSVASTVFTFVDREKTAEAHISNTTDTALAQLYAHIQSLPESSKKKKLIKQFNKQNGQGTPLQFINRDKSSSACRSIGNSIKRHIFHKTPKRETGTPSTAKVPLTPLTVQTHLNKRILFQSPSLTNSPAPELKQPQPIDTSSLSLSTLSGTSSSESTGNVSVKISETEETCEVKLVETPRPNILNNHADISHDEMIDDEDFCSSDEEDLESNQNSCQPEKLEPAPSKRTSLFNLRLMRGVSLGNLKLPFNSSAMSRSPKMKKSKSSSILIDIEKEDEKRKHFMASATESFDSEESDMFYSMCDATKEQWHVDVSNINYFLNQTEMHDHNPVRSSLSPITKSTQRMPKSMQESIMTPRSRKPVMLAIFGNSDPKSYQSNISELLEEPEDMQTESDSNDVTPQTSSEIPLNNIQLNHLRSKSESDISSANDNGLPVVETVDTRGSSSSSTSESFTSAFKEYFYSRGNLLCDQATQDDDSFSSQPNDFESSNEYQKLENSTSTSQEIEKIINQSSMSDSLLFCLNGNNANSSASLSPPKSRKRQFEETLDEESSTESIKRPLIENELTDL